MDEIFHGDMSKLPANWFIDAEYDPNNHLMQLKGKDYLNVQNRLIWFVRDQRQFIRDGLARMPYMLQTELVELDRKEGFAHFKTYVRDVFGNDATAYGSESARDFGDYPEKAGTKSLGRALLMLGYGTAFAPEMDEGERVVDAPVERKRTTAPTTTPTPKAEPPVAPAVTQKTTNAADPSRTAIDKNDQKWLDNCREQMPKLYEWVIDNKRPMLTSADVKIFKANYTDWKAQYLATLPAEPTPEPASEPTPEPTPEPVATPAPVEPTPEPAANLVPITLDERYDPKATAAQELLESVMEMAEKCGRYTSKSGNSILNVAPILRAVHVSLDNKPMSEYWTNGDCIEALQNLQGYLALTSDAERAQMIATAKTEFAEEKAALEAEKVAA